MLSIVYVLLMISAFIAAVAAGAIGGLLLTLAASVAGALVGTFLDWYEPVIWSALCCSALAVDRANGCAAPGSLE